MTDNPEASESTPRTAQTARNKRQAWLYVVIGVVLGVIAGFGLVADDRGVLDWLLLVLAVANLGIGVMGLRKPEPRLDDSTDG